MKLINDLELIKNKYYVRENSIIEDYPNLTNWNQLSKNPSALYLLEHNTDKIELACFQHNIRTVGQLCLYLTLLQKYNKNVTDEHIKNFLNGKISYNKLFIDDTLSSLSNIIDNNIIGSNDYLNIYEHKLIYLLCKTGDKEILCFLYKYYKDYISWDNIFKNDNLFATKLIEKYTYNKFNNAKDLEHHIEQLCKYKNINKKLTKFLENNMNIETISKDDNLSIILSKNSNKYIVKLLKKYKNLINWDHLSSNSNPLAIKMLRKNIERGNIDELYNNRSPLIKNMFNVNDIVYHQNLISISKNPNPVLFPIILNNIYKVDFSFLIENTNKSVLDLFFKFPNKLNRCLDYTKFLYNPLSVIYLHKILKLINYDLLLQKSLDKMIIENSGLLHKICLNVCIHKNSVC